MSKPLFQEVFNRKLNIYPQKIFLIDFLGALISALFLGLVLPRFQSYIGMPLSILYWMAAFAVILALYGITAYILSRASWKSFLKVLILGNSSYLIFSLICLIHYRSLITPLGWIYFFLEKVVLVILLRIESKQIQY